MLLLILALMLLVSALAEDEILTGYRSDFSNDFDGWYPRSTGTAELENTGIFLKITGRTAAWNSPGRDFNLTPGQKYEFSFAAFRAGVIYSISRFSINPLTPVSFTFIAMILSPSLYIIQHILIQTLLYLFYCAYTSLFCRFLLLLGFIRLF